MNVHSATCSCSVELYRLWYTLADFLPNWNFRGTLIIIDFSKYIFSPHYPIISCVVLKRCKRLVQKSGQI
jgi:hypothetical protein